MRVRVCVCDLYEASAAPSWTSPCLFACTCSCKRLLNRSRDAFFFLFVFLLAAEAQPCGRPLRITDAIPGASLLTVHIIYCYLTGSLRWKNVFIFKVAVTQRRKRKEKNPLKTKAAGEQLTAVCCGVFFFCPFYDQKHPRNRPHGVTANEPKHQRFDLLDSAKVHHHFLEERPSCRVCFPSQTDLPPQSFMLYSKAGCESLFFLCARVS